MARTRIPIELDTLPGGVRDATGTVAAAVGDAASTATDLVADLDPAVVIEPVVAFVDEAATTTAAVGREAAARARRRPAIAAAAVGAVLAVVLVIWWRRRDRRAEADLRALDEAA
jgi:hypothetical protein